MSLRLRTTAAFAAVPLTTLLALAVTGALTFPAAIAAAMAVVAGAALLAAIWLQDVARLLSTLHQHPTDPPHLSATAHVAREITRLTAARTAHVLQLTEALAAEQALVHRLPDPIIILTPDRGVERANAAAQSAYGPAIPAVLRHPDLRAALDRARGTDTPQTVAMTLPAASAREVAATVLPLPDARTVTILSDRTRERAVEQMRADFVANASHELRTPLASLIGFIDTLRGPAADDPAAQTRFLAIMAEQAQRMNRLIDDLLSLSRIELTENQPPATELNLANLLHRLAAAFEPRIEARRMTLSLTIAPDLPHLPGDADQMEQVMQNLLDNAVKYGREAGQLRIGAAPAPPAKPLPPRDGVAITVADDGQGIARAHIPRLTERFYRADKHRSRAVGGTGLGLAIVKHIINRHRGQLTVDSTEGEGTTVTVWLPLAHTVPSPATPPGNACAYSP